MASDAKLFLKIMAVVVVFGSSLSKRRSAKGVRSLFFRFRATFGHFSVTFSDASVPFFVTFCQIPFAGLLLRQGERLLRKLPGKFGVLGNCWDCRCSEEQRNGSPTGSLRSSSPSSSPSTPISPAVSAAVSVAILGNPRLGAL